MSVKIQTTFNNLPAWEEKHNKAVYRAIRGATFDMQAEVITNIKNAPKIVKGKLYPGQGAIDTGNMLQSVWVSMGSDSSRGEAQDAAMLGEKGDIKGFVGVGVKYAPYVEYGRYNVQARPFFRPAYDTTSQKLAKYLKTIK